MSAIWRVPRLGRMFASSLRLVESTCRRLLPSFQCSIHRAAIASKVVSLRS